MAYANYFENYMCGVVEYYEGSWNECCFGIMGRKCVVYAGFSALKRKKDIMINYFTPQTLRNNGMD